MINISSFHTSKSNHFGYNLLILSVIILIMGMLMTATINYYNVSNINRRTKGTQDKFKVINTALISYLAKNGKLPCPAPLDCDPEGCNNNTSGTKILGHEFRKDNDIDKECNSDNSGVFKSTKTNGNELLYGNIPAITLGLDNNYLIDNWGNKLVYIVPKDITKNNSLKEILLKTSSNESTSVKDKYVIDGEIFVLLSNGTNISGAFPYKSKKSNSFTSKIVKTTINSDGTTTTKEEKVYNLPEEDFIVDITDANYLKYHKNIDNLHNAFSTKHEDNDEIGAPDCNSVEETVKIIDESFKDMPSTVPYNGGKYKTIEFVFTGKSQSHRIPDNVTEIYLEVWGAQGGGISCAGKGDADRVGGYGGYSYGYLDTTDSNLNEIGVNNRTLYVYVGGGGKNLKTASGGWNLGGGPAQGTDAKSEGSGGGATDVRYNNTGNDYASSLNSRLIVAGGGGGYSAGGLAVGDEAGGYGGGGDNKGGNGKSHNGVTPGKGGCSANSINSSCCTNIKIGNNGAGGGYYSGGGGGGGCSSSSGGNSGGGGGGSGYIGKVSNRITPNSSGGNNDGKKGGTNGANGHNPTCGGKSDEYPIANDGKAKITYIGMKNAQLDAVVPEIEYTFTFNKAKDGEIRFANQTCPKQVSNPVSAGDYYTISDFSGDNKPARKCTKNGEWEIAYNCKIIKKCPNPVIKYSNIQWNNIGTGFDIVNTGIITGVDKTTNKTVKYECIVKINDDGEQVANYYDITNNNS